MLDFPLPHIATFDYWEGAVLLQVGDRKMWDILQKDIDSVFSPGR